MYEKVKTIICNMFFNNILENDYFTSEHTLFLKVLIGIICNAVIISHFHPYVGMTFYEYFLTVTSIFNFII